MSLAGISGAVASKCLRIRRSSPMKGGAFFAFNNPIVLWDILRNVGAPEG